jgi:hypothetical protein
MSILEKEIRHKILDELTELFGENRELYKYLSFSPLLTIEYIRSNINKNWDLPQLCKNKFTEEIKTRYRRAKHRFSIISHRFAARANMNIGM